MVRYEYQTCLRMSNTLKDDMTDICEKHTINESDLIRRAIATFVENLKGQTEDRNRPVNPPYLAGLFSASVAA